MKEIVNYIDIWYQVTYERGEDTYLRFIANKILSMQGNSDIPLEIEEVPCLDGYVKFDGCMNVLFEKGLAHFCGRYQTQQYGELFNKIYDKAIELGMSDD